MFFNDSGFHNRNALLHAIYCTVICRSVLLNSTARTLVGQVFMDKLIKTKMSLAVQKTPKNNVCSEVVYYKFKNDEPFF